jgi:hypothetical protein
MRDTPTSDIFTVENSVIFNDNKTSEWLKMKTPSEKKTLISEAIQETRQITRKQKLQQHLKVFKETSLLGKQRIVDEAVKVSQDDRLWSDVHVEIAKLKNKIEDCLFVAA